jgi:hypothetical protein
MRTTHPSFRTGPRISNLCRGTVIRHFLVIVSKPACFQREPMGEPSASNRAYLCRNWVRSAPSKRRGSDSPPARIGPCWREPREPSAKGNIKRRGSSPSSEDRIALARKPTDRQMWKQEARAANATIAEIYQLCSGGKGEPGNWNGAEPVRRKLAELNAEERG